LKIPGIGTPVFGCSNGVTPYICNVISLSGYMIYYPLLAVSWQGQGVFDQKYYNPEYKIITLGIQLDEISVTCERL
jgi:hypothetical protein